MFLLQIWFFSYPRLHQNISPLIHFPFPFSPFADYYAILVLLFLFLLCYYCCCSSFISSTSVCYDAKNFHAFLLLLHQQKKITVSTNCLHTLLLLLSLFATYCLFLLLYNLLCSLTGKNEARRNKWEKMKTFLWYSWHTHKANFYDIPFKNYYPSMHIIYTTTTAATTHA